MPNPHRILPLGFKATQEVRKLADENPDANLKDLAAFSGYNVYQVAEALKGPKRFAHIRSHWLKPGPPPPIPKGKNKLPEDKEAPNEGPRAKLGPRKPKFIREIEKHTGLRCQYRGKVEQFTEWFLMSPTNVPLFAVYGKSDILQGCMPPKPSHIQGLPWVELKARRHKKRSLEPTDGEVKADEELDSEPD